MAYTETQLKVLGYLQKSSGGLSTLCSLYLIYIVLSDRKKRCKPYHRLVAGISCFDTVGSFAMFLSTWPIPKESGLLWAIGNDTTCNVQGYFAQFIIGSAMYNTCLSVYYYLVILHNWNDRQIETIEPLLHLLPLIFTIGTATSALVLDLYGNAFFWCWIRGDQNNYRWGLFYIPNWIMIFVITYICGRVWYHVRKVEQQIEQYNPTTSLQLSAAYQASSMRQMSGGNRTQSTGSIIGDRSGSMRIKAAENNDGTTSATMMIPEQPLQPQSLPSKKQKKLKKILLAQRRKQHWRTRLVARQCFLYAAAFYFTWLGATLNRVLGVVLDETYYGILVITAFTTPILGLPNFIVYLLPKFRHIRKENPTSGWYQWIKRTLLKGNDADETTLDMDATSMAILPSGEESSEASGAIIIIGGGGGTVLGGPSLTTQSSSVDIAKTITEEH